MTKNTELSTRFLNSSSIVWALACAILLVPGPLLAEEAEEEEEGPAFKVIEVQQTGGFAGVKISYRITPDGKFTRPPLPEGQFAFNAHRFFMENPSLSGRGSAGAADVPKLAHTED